MTSTTSTMETQGVELDIQDETEGTPNRNRKNPLNRLKDRVKQLDALSRNKGLKATKQADVALEAASIERLLYNDSRDDKNNETLALNAQLPAAHVGHPQFSCILPLTSFVSCVLFGSRRFRG